MKTFAHRRRRRRGRSGRRRRICRDSGGAAGDERRRRHRGRSSGSTRTRTGRRRTTAPTTRTRTTTTTTRMDVDCAATTVPAIDDGPTASAPSCSSSRSGPTTGWNGSANSTGCRAAPNACPILRRREKPLRRRRRLRLGAVRSRRESTVANRFRCRPQGR